MINFKLENILFANAPDKHLCFTDSHVHSYWELKVFPEGKGQSSFPRIEIVPDGIVHKTTRNMFEKNCNIVLALKRPGILVQQKIQDRKLIESIGCFDELDNLCPGGVELYLKKIRSICTSKMNKEVKAKLLNNLLNFIICSAQYIASDSSDKHPKPYYSLTEKARDYIERYYYKDDISVQKVAKHVGSGAGHLANLFKKESLGTVRHYLISTRLKHAYKLLETGTYTVKEVAEITGWTNQFYFSNSFKKHYKIPPSKVPVSDGTEYPN